ncbi:MAPEG family protein [Xylariaceae sp. FL0804]|nr:MAPEG family protein [Xylariaceae sp. FL0804]
MSYALQVPREYGYVLTAAASSFFVNTYHFYLTATARKASGLAYPIPYATAEQAEKDPKAFRFNTAQRAHSNYTENLAPFVGALLIAGLEYPMPAAYLGATWVVGRFWYAYGYVNQGPPGRIPGFLASSLSDLGLKVMAVLAGYHLSQAA